MSQRQEIAQSIDAGPGRELTVKPTTAARAAVPAAAWGLRHARSAAVKSWSPSTLPGTKTGRLFARVSGNDDQNAVILLHGLISTGDIFGRTFDQLAASAKLVVPDLPGFGRSLDEDRAGFTLAHHLDMLDELADEQGLFDRRWTVGAHSMGSTLALAWADRHHRNVDKVVCWGAPVFRTSREARTSIAGNTMARLFALDTRLAELACSFSCEHRAAAGWIAAALAPALPVAISRAAPLHTWPAYRDALHHLVMEPDWDQLLGQIATNSIETSLIWGRNDPIGDPRFAREVTADHPYTKVATVSAADHHLPLSHPALCLRHLTEESSIQ